MACLAALTISAPVPEADPDAFLNLGAVAVPAITGSALIDGLLLGKVAFLKGKWRWSVSGVSVSASSKQSSGQSQQNWLTPACSRAD